MKVRKIIKSNEDIVTAQNILRSVVESKYFLTYLQNSDQHLIFRIEREHILMPIANSWLPIVDVSFHNLDGTTSIYMVFKLNRNVKVLFIMSVVLTMLIVTAMLGGVINQLVPVWELFVPIGMIVVSGLWLYLGLNAVATSITSTISDFLQ